jgi:hypothetical protein
MVYTGPGEAPPAIYFRKFGPVLKEHLVNHLG